MANQRKEETAKEKRRLRFAQRFFGAGNISSDLSHTSIQYGDYCSDLALAVAEIPYRRFAPYSARVIQQVSFIRPAQKSSQKKRERYGKPRYHP